jgi:hypothetical protein
MLRLVLGDGRDVGGQAEADGRDSGGELKPILLITPRLI